MWPVICSMMCGRKLRNPSAELSVCEFEGENVSNSGEVQSVGEKFDDAAQDGYVVVAVPARPPGRAIWCEESFAFIEPQVLLANAGHFGCNGDAVRTTGARHILVQNSPEN